MVDEMAPGSANAKEIAPDSANAKDVPLAANDVKAMQAAQLVVDKVVLRDRAAEAKKAARATGNGKGLKELLYSLVGTCPTFEYYKATVEPCIRDLLCRARGIDSRVLDIDMNPKKDAATYDARKGAFFSAYGLVTDDAADVDFLAALDRHRKDKKYLSNRAQYIMRQVHEAFRAAGKIPEEEDAMPLDADGGANSFACSGALMNLSAANRSLEDAVPQNRHPPNRNKKLAVSGHFDGARPSRLGASSSISAGGISPAALPKIDYVSTLSSTWKNDARATTPQEIVPNLLTLIKTTDFLLAMTAAPAANAMSGASSAAFASPGTPAAAAASASSAAPEIEPWQWLVDIMPKIQALLQSMPPSLFVETAAYTTAANGLQHSLSKKGLKRGKKARGIRQPAARRVLPQASAYGNPRATRSHASYSKPTPQHVRKMMRDHPASDERELSTDRSNSSSSESEMDGGGDAATDALTA